MVEVHMEPGGETMKESEMERCCFCRTPTIYWTSLSERTAGQQVACCPGCAKYAKPEEVPGKREWCMREEIATGRRGKPDFWG